MAYDSWALVTKNNFLWLNPLQDEICRIDSSLRLAKIASCVCLQWHYKFLFRHLHVMSCVLSLHFSENFFQRILSGVSIVSGQVIEVESVVRSYHVDIMFEVDIVFQVL